MSTALDLLNRVRPAGGTVEPEGDRLNLRAPQPLPAALLNELREHKAELLAIMHPLVPLDQHGLPFQPCRCGSHYFWRHTGGAWRCYDCQPYTDLAGPMTTITLSRGMAVIESSEGNKRQ